MKAGSALSQANVSLLLSGDFLDGVVLGFHVRRATWEEYEYYRNLQMASSVT
jgi:hypothetical protein